MAEGELIQRKLPFSLEAEQSVLGSILIDPECFNVIAGILKSEDFYIDSHVQIYLAMQDLYLQNRSIDVVTLIDTLVHRGVYDEKTSQSYIKLIADVGLIGFPNVGKSTLLSRVTNAEPKIANYHFTTLNPNLGVVDLDGAKGFVMADIPGLIEGASEGVGLGHEFLRHIERTKLMIHVVDAAGTEGRDPVDDIHKINAELAAYNPEIAERPQVIAANKTDLIYDPEDDPVQRLKDEFEPKGIKVFPISGATGKGISDLLYYVSNELQKLDQKPVVFEQEYFPDDELIYEDLPYTVEQVDGMYVVEGPKIEKMLGYTNLDSEKGFAFFQKFLKDSGILEDLENAGIQEGDTVRMYGLQFDYYK